MGRVLAGGFVEASGLWIRFEVAGGAGLAQEGVVVMGHGGLFAVC